MTSIYRVKLSGFISILQVLLLVVSFSYPLLYPKTANATVTTAYMRLDRQSAGAALSGVVCLQTSTSGTEAKVLVTFPSAFTISTLASDFTVDTTAGNLPSGATAWPTIATANNVSSKTVTFPGGDLTSSANLYCFHFTGANSTTGTAGNDLTGTIVTQTAASAAIDTVSYATSVTSGANSDQISVTGAVPATFTFGLSGGTGGALSLGTLNSSTVTTAASAVTATISTNARNGFISWVKGANSDGLHSPTTTTGITSPGSYPTVTDLASSTGYGIFAAAGTNTPTIAAGYTSGNSTSVGHIDATAFYQVANLTGVQSGTTFTISARAKPASTQLAANDYADTLTVVASGSF